MLTCYLIQVSVSLFFNYVIHFLLLFCLNFCRLLSHFTKAYRYMYMRNSYVLLAEILLLRWCCCCCVSWSVFHYKVSYIFFNRPWLWHSHRHYSWNSWSKMSCRMKEKKEKRISAYFVASQPVKMKCSPNQKIHFFFAILDFEKNVRFTVDSLLSVCACVRFVSLLFARWLIQLYSAAMSMIF